MHAIVQDTYGPADVLELREIERPHIGPDEVLIRVKAAGVGREVWHLMTGLPYLGRLAFGIRAPKTRVPGIDLAGIVEATGAAVTRFRPGDAVFGIGKGTFAEYARAPESKLATKPSSVSFEQAAAVPVSGSTALQAVRDHGRVQPGNRVLVIGASGGVGTFAVQIAKHFGGDVTGVCSTAKVDLVRALGADHVIDYTRKDFADDARHYDVIIDTGGNPPLSRLRRALTADGTLVIVGGEGAGRWLGGIDRQLRATVLSVFVRQKLGMFINDENHQDLTVLAELMEARLVTPAVDTTYALRDAAGAVRHVENGRARGKVVITIDS